MGEPDKNSIVFFIFNLASSDVIEYIIFYFIFEMKMTLTIIKSQEHKEAFRRLTESRRYKRIVLIVLMIIMILIAIV